MIVYKQRDRGFTLIELMVTLAIAAVLLLVAIPSMTAYKRNAELTSATNTLLSAINGARGEAMKRGMYAMVVPADGADWNTGWIVFVDKNRSQAYDATVDQTVLNQGPLPGYFSVTGNGTAATGSAPYIMFDASGYSKTKSSSFGDLTLTLTRTDLSGSALDDQTRRVVVAKTGRTRTCRPSTDASCTVSASQ
ncbi:GspH/FimT family pseudopilin [Polaromonas sp.]|uniref:GspH/FimT family pseudopilin n=1 Tax=Polaromonas sp. TaxID=1869339 RepID=UPI0017FBA777|nr:GspH/FimT family pseudopilin [Polaromonas sp.]NML87024.1 prepilin-type N-terminal cleavage/methylation domain-containing protein [Polaromonas sp.]